jgi:hypothetical protein
MSARQGTVPSQDPLHEIEERLAGALQPVQPRRSFVQRLRDRIRLASPRVIVRRVTDWQFLLLAIGGVISVGALLLTLARALFHFFRGKS